MPVYAGALPLHDATSGKAICAALRGYWHGNQGKAYCPAHPVKPNDPSPALSVTQVGAVTLIHCHFGCSQLSVIAALRELGLWPDRDEAGHPSYPQLVHTPQRDSEADADELTRIAKAQAIWDGAAPIEGTHGEAYLRARAIRGALPAALRFAARLYHRASGRYLPALIGALLDGDDRILAVQRIYLEPDAPAKFAPPNKLTLGPMRRTAVRLGMPDRVLGLAEGIETALSAMDIFALPVWAVLGKNRLDKIALPETVEHVVIFADRDEAGQNSASEAVAEYRERGLLATIETPDEGYKDWNDLAQADAS